MRFSIPVSIYEVMMRSKLTLYTVFRPCGVNATTRSRKTGTRLSRRHCCAVIFFAVEMSGLTTT